MNKWLKLSISIALGIVTPVVLSMIGSGIHGGPLLYLAFFPVVIGEVLLSDMGAAIFAPLVVLTLIFWAALWFGLLTLFFGSSGRGA